MDDASRRLALRSLSWGLLFVRSLRLECWCVRQTDDQALWGLKSGDGLSPRLELCAVEESEPVSAQFFGGDPHPIRVRHLELDARLRNRSICRPFRGAEAGFRCLGQRPHAKALTTVYLLAVDIAVRLTRQWQPERIDIKTSARRSVRTYHRDTANELHIHDNTPKRRPMTPTFASYADDPGLANDGEQLKRGARQSLVSRYMSLLDHVRRLEHTHGYTPQGLAIDTDGGVCILLVWPVRPTFGLAPPEPASIEVGDVNSQTLPEGACWSKM